MFPLAFIASAINIASDYFIPLSMRESRFKSEFS